VSICPWCHTDSAICLFSRRDRLGAGTFPYVRCDHCGLVRLDPMPSWAELQEHYPEDYEAFQEVRENWLFRLGRQRLWSRRVHAIQRHLRLESGSILDVGCATGEFLEVMQRRGWTAAGIEPNPAAAARARERFASDIVQGVPLEEAVLPEASFDLITLWDVLEHLVDPAAALRGLARSLRPTGLLALGVPSLDSWDAHLFGPAWIGYDAPRHLYLFPDAVLRAMLAAAGLIVVATRCVYGDYGAFVLSLDFALHERYGDRPAGRALRRLAALRPWRYLLWPYFRLAEGLNRGPIRTYFCLQIVPRQAIMPPGRSAQRGVL
jgi:2-polyprenyl-3-methyl-5-hydroxy-6-metoxy-1,4-benzoquinol methylase